MISFIMALIALILGYCIYGRIVERVAGPTDNPTPAISHADGIDYIAMPSWRVFYDTISKHRRNRSYLWCHYGCMVWSGRLSLDSIWLYFCRRHARLLCGNVKHTPRRCQHASTGGHLSGNNSQKDNARFLCLPIAHGRRCVCI